ncbi:hypothetical protein R0131_09375 [Clostridium sp. AL.422]|uniref:hypothetical protein n=1 Tax=Clostridium TaxID=1485 RepID=UPI00293DF949|nr:MULTISPECIES: hypothetical protein [unclassified Clostridium]MDV4151048.1 hypothetical protein [Clostridium sp. AL.422]
MKIIIKSKDINLKLYIPTFILTSGIRLTKFINKTHSKYNNSNKDIQDVMNYIDMDFIIYAIKELKAYKGLTLIEVRASDGTYVLIKV